MPTPAIATLVRGRGDKMGISPPFLRRTPTGMQGERSFKINCADEDWADQASGLPKVNDQWSSRLPTLLVSSVTIQRIGGTDDAVTALGGVCAAKVEYQTPNFRGSGTGAKAGDKWTVMSTSTASIQRIFAVDGGVGNPPIAGGRGVPVNIGVIRAQVVTYPIVQQGTPLVNFTLLFKLTREQALNKVALQLPAVQGTPIPINLDIHNVQYVGFQIDVDNGLTRVTHTLNLSDNFQAAYQLEDSKGGLVSGTPILANVYPEEDFTGLW